MLALSEGDFMPIVVRQGTGQKGAYLFVHGSPGDHRVFQKLAARAPQDVHVALVDLPDHGRAPDTLSLGLEPFEDDLVGCIEALPRGPRTVVGSSFGGHLVARIMARVATSVTRAVFIDSFAAVPPEMAARQAGLADQIETGQLDGPTLEALAVNLFLGGEGDREDVELVRATVRDCPRPRLVRACRRLAALDAGEIHPFAVPTVVVHSKQDPAVPFALAPALAACGANTRLLGLEGHSHYPQMTKAGTVADIVFGA
jgi:pimeloyl-ACP methyl ester carboxylesterase